MAEYLAPGVYVEETSFRSKSIAGVGTSTAAFVGMTQRGPVGITPPLLTSFSDFELYYGGLEDLNVGTAMPNYLAHAAFAFFANGGARLYVARVKGVGAAAATVLANPANPAPADNKKITISARYPGGGTVPGTNGVTLRAGLTQTALASTKRLAARQQAGTLVQSGNTYFVMGGPGAAPLATSGGAGDWDGLADTAPVSIVTLAIDVTGPGGVIAEHPGLGLHPSHPRYVGRVVGQTPPLAANALTNPLAVIVGGAVSPFELRAGLMAGADDLGNGVFSRTVDLKGGVDGTGAPASDDYDDAFDLLLALEDISIVAAPGSSAFAAPTPADVAQKLIGHAETRRAYRIAVLDTPPNLEPGGVRDLKGLIDSEYAALYYPWIRIANPLAGADPTQPSLIDVPPSGAVCGIYARSDIARGVFKAPANEVVTGALGLQRDVRFGEQEVLNPLGINCIRALPNRGIRIWGARTISSDPEWIYVNVRRYFLYLEASIDQGTQWAVFEPNGEHLWANVRTTISDFLYNEWLSGALLGASPKEAFFVQCDRTTMTQNDLDNGRLVCLVGVAAVKPAEFVIFRIGQKTADSRD